MIHLHSLLLLLATAVLTVVACRHFKLPAMLGYLLVGMLIMAITGSMSAM